MGIARIVSGGPTGRYTIEVDTGTADQAAQLAELNTRVVALDAEILAAQVAVAEADSTEQDIINQMAAAQEAYVLAATASGGDILPSDEIDGLIFLLNFTRAQNTPLRIKLDILENTRKVALERVAALNSANMLLTKQAWCTDFTEDGAGTNRATIDIPGEQNLQLLAPGCRAWTFGDGFLKARELMSPDQVYFNAAILPGWQKFKPTYRWGTLTAINYDADTADVSLASAVSSAQSLGVNQASALSGVPVVYMECNAEAFEVGDRVVVQFIGQDWSTPRVIGFLDNPKPCVVWPRISVRFALEGSFIAGSGSRSWLAPVETENCGPGVVQTARTISDQLNATELLFSGAEFYDAPGEPEVPPGMSIYSAVMPPAMELGDFNLSIVAASTLSNPLAVLDVPTGASPGSLLWLQKTGGTVAFKVASFPFTETTDNEWTFTDDPPTCTPTSRTAPKFDGHVVNDASLVNWTGTTLHGPGAITTIPEALPTIVVEYSGRRRNYVLESAAEFPFESSAWRFLFRAGSWIES